MEEVWKDITLNTASPIVENSAAHQAYFHHQGPAGHGSIAGVHLSHFRDFLSRPLKAATASVAAVPVQPAAEGSSRSAQPPTGSTPATCLSLNSGVDFQHMETMIPGTCPADRRHHSSSSTSSSLTAVTFSDSPFPGLFVFCNNKKRAPQQQQPNAGNGSGAGDSRNKRMIKNRESAARSRARKQAYTNELELEVNHLTKENEMLRRQHEERSWRPSSSPRGLSRSSTAPF
ncbi:unnamed protein product [Spirodela intermedia]|uniref:BZIP domain-containing protein n=1 Tax=Spirodela intermedia TaxID=51605 RepID=A0A7I8J945_SPIIN|nr:unnamed protein product [Spirodela intermedia]CAA6666707.1 unnamed protein product [Spirodela intermedia]